MDRTATRGDDNSGNLEQLHVNNSLEGDRLVLPGKLVQIVRISTDTTEQLRNVAKFEDVGKILKDINKECKKHARSVAQKKKPRVSLILTTVSFKMVYLESMTDWLSLPMNRVLYLHSVSVGVSRTCRWLVADEDGLQVVSVKMGKKIEAQAIAEKVRKLRAVSCQWKEGQGQVPEKEQSKLQSLTSALCRISQLADQKTSQLADQQTSQLADQQTSPAVGEKQSEDGSSSDSVTSSTRPDSTETPEVERCLSAEPAEAPSTVGLPAKLEGSDAPKDLFACKDPFASNDLFACGNSFAPDSPLLPVPLLAMPASSARGMSGVPVGCLLPPPDSKRSTRRKDAPLAATNNYSMPINLLPPVAQTVWNPFGIAYENQTSQPLGVVGERRSTNPFETPNGNQAPCRLGVATLQQWQSADPLASLAGPQRAAVPLGPVGGRQANGFFQPPAPGAGPTGASGPALRDSDPFDTSFVRRPTAVHHFLSALPLVPNPNSA